MEVTGFIAYVYSDEEPGSDFQAKLYLSKNDFLVQGSKISLNEPNSDDAIRHHNFIGDINNYLIKFFITRLYSSDVPTRPSGYKENKPSVIYGFLEYHLSQYNGDPIDYFDFVKSCLEDSNYHPDESPQRKRADKSIKRWIKNQRGQNVTNQDFSIDKQHESYRPTNTENLKKKLSKYGFNSISKVEALNDNSRDKLIQMISQNDHPYQVSMFNYLGFIKHLQKEYSDSMVELDKIISDLLDFSERSAKGNRLVLDEYSKENRSRYTAHHHKEKVEKDYQRLK